jgi:hypothetical protein
VLAAACLAPAVFALAPDQASYYGGTVNPAFLRGGFPATPNSYGAHTVKGRIDTRSSTEFVFDAGRNGKIAIPYASIASIVYGPLSLGPPLGGRSAPPSYRWSGMPHHTRIYLTLFIKDEPSRGGIALELGRDTVRPTLQALERGTGTVVTTPTLEACLQSRSADDCGQGDPRELRGTTAVFVDVSGSYGPSIEESRQRITSAIGAARSGLRVVESVASADVILVFHYDKGCNVPGPECGPDVARGEVYVVHTTGLRVVQMYEQRWNIYHTGLATRFAKAFVQAHEKANGVK